VSKITWRGLRTFSPASLCSQFSVGAGSLQANITYLQVSIHVSRYTYLHISRHTHFQAYTHLRHVEYTHISGIHPQAYRHTSPGRPPRSWGLSNCGVDLDTGTNSATVVGCNWSRFAAVHRQRPSAAINDRMIAVLATVGPRRSFARVLLEQYATNQGRLGSRASPRSHWPGSCVRPPPSKKTRRRRTGSLTLLACFPVHRFADGGVCRWGFAFLGQDGCGFAPIDQYEGHGTGIAEPVSGAGVIVPGE